MSSSSRKKRNVPAAGCRRVNLTLPNALLEQMDKRVARGNRSRFLSYCARSYLAALQSDETEQRHWDRMIKGLLND